MKELVFQNLLRFGCIFVILMIQGISRSASFSPKDSILGAAPEDDNYYKGLSSRGTIKCKDGSKKFNKSHLNDDFCDCADGSDEPGTSACPNGKFFCKNTGHTPLVLYSSRVNDGICDCCDGSDEYNSKIKCSNTCWEAGKVARDRLMKKIATYQEGVTMRKRIIEQAKLAIAKDEVELSKLKNEEKVLSGLVQELKEHKERIEEAEEKERLQKEKEEKERREAEYAEEKKVAAGEKGEDIEYGKNDIHDEMGVVDQHLQNSGGDLESIREPEHNDHRTKEELSTHIVEEHGADSFQDTEQKLESSTFDDGKAVLDTDNVKNNDAEDTESLSREELGRLVASRWTGEKNDQPSQELDVSLDKDQENRDETEETNEEYNGYDSESNGHEYDDEDDDVEHIDEFEGGDHDVSSSSHIHESDDESSFSDITSTIVPSWLEKIQKTVRSIFKAVNLFKTPIDKSDAERVRKEYDESSAKLSKLQSRITSLTQKLKQDFGPEKEFHSFYGQCFEINQNKYVYKICPFKQATQVEGHSTSGLGNWEKFDDSYRIMLFSNGDKCWNGPDRSLKVKLRCGLRNEATDIDEPSRCEYLALLSTPALCLDHKLKELQEKLEAPKREQPVEVHDEL
ncbi:glucosidase 2 subunit beta isoform X1 [Primulina tabacum]|uniref:glucosidase 2 subunit beta isoform X1 n=1 Tax=Primulina tabacum TaxID=48773 RepID=UPI003F5AC26F